MANQSQPDFAKVCDVKFAMAKQTALGTAITAVDSADMVLALDGGAPVGINREMERVGGADGICADSLTRLNLEYYQRSFQLPCVPSIMAYIKAFIDTRDDYGDPQVHTLWWDLGYQTLKMQDVVCTGYTFVFEAGRPVVLTVDVQGRTRNDSNVLLTGETISAVPVAAAKYLCKEVTAAYGATGAAATTARFRRLEIRVNRNVPGPAEQARVDPLFNPRYASATGNDTVDLTLVDDFRDATFWTQYLTFGTQKEVKATMSDGAVTTILTCPRCEINEITADVGADRQSFLNNNVTMWALCDTAGASEHIVWS